jgi:phosphate transport system substrate-binding protein
MEVFLMNNSSLRASVFLLVLLLCSTLTGCEREDNAQKNGEVSGLVTASGSTALQPLAEQAGKSFTEKYPDAIINIQGGGSGTGLTQVMQGAVDIGNSDISAEDKLKPEFANQLVDHKVCAVGFGVVVNNKVKIDNITKEELIKIFTGEIKNWKEVGGEDIPIAVINRPKSSGTRATFKKYALEGRDEVQGKVLTQDSSGAVQKTIQSNEGAIGYLASSFLYQNLAKSQLKLMKIDGVEMSKENISNGSYKIWSYEHMYTKGEPKGLTKMFLDYMVSKEVEPVIEKLGYIPTSSIEATR